MSWVVSVSCLLLCLGLLEGLALLLCLGLLQLLGVLEVLDLLLCL